MKIARWQLRDKRSLFARLRKVTLENSDVPIYKNSKIRLLTMDPNDLHPAQYYVLKGELEKIAYLRSLILEKGIDIFTLDGYLKIWTNQNDVTFVDILPPVVEESAARNGRKVPIICDGLHRLYLALKLKAKVNVVFIQDVPQRYPYYAYPNKNGWNDIVEMGTLPVGYVKKDYRTKNHRKLFRDFNSAFDNVGRRRKFGEGFVFRLDSKH